jgi:hypothetical protein
LIHFDVFENGQPRFIFGEQMLTICGTLLRLWVPQE